MKFEPDSFFMYHDNMFYLNKQNMMCLVAFREESYSDTIVNLKKEEYVNYIDTSQDVPATVKNIMRINIIEQPKLFSLLLERIIKE